MIDVLELRLHPEAYAEENMLPLISKKTGISPKRITNWEICRRSIDARKKPVQYVLKIKVWVDEEAKEEPTFDPKLQSVANGPEIHIVGMGPCGLFAALNAVANGYKPIIWERGKAVRDRRRDLAQLTKQGILNPESNYCFGEGGAGTFSDGKLYTRSTKRGKIENILQMLVYFGAPSDILVDAHPHIGTNKLPKIIANIRQCLIDCGAEIHFNSKITNIRKKGSQLEALEVNGTYWISCKKLLLATGHSARDIFRMIHKMGLTLAQKPLAVGVRIEHPQVLIDSIQYHSSAERPLNLPPASYNWSRNVQERGVHSFCMCPGGIICPAATSEGEVVVNGWSPSKRNGPFANSGIVVQITGQDITPKSDSPLLLMEWQAALEAKAYQAGGGNFFAPGQRLGDFLSKRISNNLPECSYLPGIDSAPLHELLPPFIYSPLATALRQIGKRMKGYISNEAVVVGVESRTSSPVKIPRDPYSRMHPECEGLYPCGEGAGYAGGIMSAAIDGWNTAQVACVPVEY